MPTPATPSEQKNGGTSATPLALDTIVALAKRRGFVYPTSEIYGGLANSYDYGPMGAELLRRIRALWWQYFITGRADMVGLDTQIILHPQTWVASGHVGSFSDPLVEDTVTHKRYRADHLLEAWLEKNPKKSAELFSAGLGVPVAELPDKKWEVPDLSIEQMGKAISTLKILSPDGNPINEPRSFNLLFESSIGSVSGDKSKVYLRGETAQGIFADFKQVLDSTRVQLPFGIGNIGKSFRNEITTGQFVFRTLEFEQGEIEYFFNPEETDWTTLLNEWKQQMWEFVTQVLGIKEENLRWRRHTDTERSFYSKDTYDLEYHYPFGWKELWGVAYRTDYDLSQHMKFSGVSLEYTDPHTGKKFVPHVIEPAVGINRIFLMILCDAYYQDMEKERTLLRLSSNVAPVSVAVFPLLKNKPELVAKARELAQSLRVAGIAVSYDERGNIGKRYLAQDEVGTPVCLTVDFESLEDGTVTWRDRDTGEQVRVAMADVVTKLQ